MRAVWLVLSVWFAYACTINAGAVYKTSSPVSRPRPDAKYDPFRQDVGGEDIAFRGEADGDKPADAHTCSIDISLAWATEVEASVYSSPLIAPLRHDGKKQIITPTAWQHVELLEHDGHKAFGWPISFEGSNFHSSPLLYDIDGDGQDDIVVADSSGRVLFVDVDDQGQYVRDFMLQIPRLGVQRDWADGLGADGVEPAAVLSTFESLDAVPHRAETGQDALNQAEQAPHSGERVFARAAQRGTASDGFGPLPKRKVSDDEQAKSGRASARVPLGVEDDAFSTEAQSGEDEQSPAIELLDGGFILVDAHVLTTPMITDLNGDGGSELIVAVSYFFDQDVYQDEYFADDGTTIDPSAYAATGVVCYDLENERWLWQVHLDLSTSWSNRPSRLYAAPTVADLDADGQREVVVATMAGNLFAILPDGSVKTGFPVELDGPVQAQVLVEDVAGDAALEMLVAGDEGHIVMLNTDGSVVWTRHILGASPVAPCVGDVDGDGALEVVVTGRDGGVWALDAESGLDIDNFPIRTHGKIMAPTTLLKLRVKDTVASPDDDIKLEMLAADVQSSDGLQLVIPCHDGFIYIISGATGCVNKVAVHEHVYAAVVADDLTEDGNLELLVGTMSGNVLAFATTTPYHPLNAQPQFPMGGNSFAFRLGYHGVFFVENSHHYRNIVGPTIKLQFEIVDKRPSRSPPRDARYSVTISKGRQVLFDKQYSEPGVYTAQVTLNEPQRVSLTIRMENEHGQVFWDVSTLTFNLGFYQVLKWMVVLPFTLAAGLLVFLQPRTTPLPS